ncbi:MAG TPA: hypothetical protein VEK08_11325 [Planctomycetota bacterium]|nr:hypothetical protein [Planctomycetota bacterium]
MPDSINRAARFALPLIGLLLLAGCEKSVPRTDYMPLRDGNRWEYRLLDMPLLKRLEAGQVIETAPREDDASVPRADNEKHSEASSGAKAVARRVVLDMRDAVDELTYKAVYDTAEQVWSKKNGYIGFQSVRGRSYLLILPPHTGYKWVVTGSGGEDLFFEIESASASVTTPAGAFSQCVVARQESRDRKEIFKYWFAPAVGLVRRSKFFAGEEVFRQELVEYIVKPATPATRMAEDREVRRAIEGKNRGSEFRELAKDERDRRLESIDPPENDRFNEKVRKYADPR